MTAPDTHSFPPEWGYRPAARGAVEAAFDVFASAMTDTEWAEFVARVRPTGAH